MRIIKSCVAAIAMALICHLQNVGGQNSTMAQQGNSTMAGQGELDSGIILVDKAPVPPYASPHPTCPECLKCKECPQQWCPPQWCPPPPPPQPSCQQVPPRCAQQCYRPAYEYPQYPKYPDYLPYN